MKQTVIAIVPAAGSGKRFGSETNKAFFEILGKPIVIRTLDVFQKSDVVSEIIPVFSEADIDRGLNLIETYGLDKIKRVAPGGRERQDSVYNALKLIDDRRAVIVIHDGVRPLLDDEILSRCVRALKDCDGVVTGVPLKDTVKEVKDGIALKTLDRGNLMAIQTPQVFRHEALLSAYDRIKNKNRIFTDDAAVVEAAGGKVTIVEGSHKNIKVTTREDAFIVEAFLRARE